MHSKIIECQCPIKVNDSDNVFMHSFYSNMFVDHYRDYLEGEYWEVDHEL